MSPETYAQIKATYKRMAREALYRPAAPSDGWGNITVPQAELDLNDEARRFALSFGEQECEQHYYIGCPDFTDRPALIFIVEAAELLCSVERSKSVELLKMAIEEIQSTIEAGHSASLADLFSRRGV